MIINLTRQAFILIPALIILPRIFGYEGVLWAEPVADAAAFCLTLVWISNELRRLSDKEQDMPGSKAGPLPEEAERVS